MHIGGRLDDQNKDLDGYHNSQIKCHLHAILRTQATYPEGNLPS